MKALLDVDFYTFHNRGSDRSEFRQCDATAALTPGSPGGSRLTADELPSCLKDLSFQYNGQAAAFSTTSAAMDVRLIIDTFLVNHHVYIYGRSYGTYLAQRILQLQNTADPRAMKGPARRLLEFCFDDPDCPIQMGSRETALEDVLEFTNKLNTEPSECANIIATSQQKASPSDTLRVLLFPMVKEFSTRASGLGILGAVQRCSDKDLAGLHAFLEQASEPLNAAATPASLDPLNDINVLLNNVVVYSERWAQPAPTTEESTKFFRETPFALDGATVSMGYCLFTGSTEPACQNLQIELPPSDATFVYKRDEYYDEPITLPDHATALIFNGGLDFETPREFGELLYSKLQGSGKGVMMVDFDYGKHCQGEAVVEAATSPCRGSIVLQFVTSGDDVGAIDTDCMKTLPETWFHTAEEMPSA